MKQKNENHVHELEPVYIYQWIGFREQEYDQWYKAQIIAFDPDDDKRFKVLYKHKYDKYTIWIIII